MKYTIIIIILSMILIGCEDKMINIEAESTGECIIKCKEMMKKNTCFSAKPISQEIINENMKINNTCECVLLDCLR